MKRISGLLFDKDGTLLDFYKTWIPINRQMTLEIAGGDPDLAMKLLHAGGHNPETDLVTPGSILAGAGVSAIAACFADALGERAPADLDDIVARNFSNGGEKHAVLIEGVTEHIASLRTAGYRLGLATNDTTAGLQASLSRFEGLLDLFEYRVGCDSGHGNKPEPGMATAFASAIGAEPSACAMIGDSIHDLETGRRAGFGLRIGVLTGPARREDLEAHADIVLDSVLDLADALDEWHAAAERPSPAA